MDLGAQENISLYKKYFRLEPLEKQTRRSSPGASCPRGFAFQGSCAAAGAGARDRGGSWGIPGRVGHLQQVWQNWAWREGQNKGKLMSVNSGTADCPGGGGCLIPHPVQGGTSINF